MTNLISMKAPISPSTATHPDQADIAIAQADAKKRIRQRWLMTTIVAGLVASYPLSIGPAAWLHTQRLSPELNAAIEYVYAPLIWLGDNNKKCKAVFQWYVTFFVGPPPVYR